MNQYMSIFLEILSTRITLEGFSFSISEAVLFFVFVSLICYLLGGVFSG